MITDTLDFFLLKNCQSYISNATGLDYLAFIFDKPMLINSASINDFFIEKPNIVYILRPYFSKQQKKKFLLMILFQNMT